MSFPHGDTDLYLLAGDPVTNVRLPRMFNHLFEAGGVAARMVPVRVRARDFAVWMKASFLADNVKGMLVAPPHKPLAVPLLNGAGLYARVAGSVNVIRRMPHGELEGDLFDGEGIIAALDYYGMPFRGRRVLVLGAGVTGAAIGVSLTEGGGDAGAAQLCFHDPAPGRAEGLAARIDAAFDADVRAVHNPDPAGFDLVINASAAGLSASDPLPVDVTRMEAHAALFDVLLRNQPTPLVQAARARGLCAQPGFEMLVQQLPCYLDYFGLPELAERARANAPQLRALIYPDVLRAEIERPLRYGGPGVSGEARSDNPHDAH